jgi:hypothetical protein
MTEQEVARQAAPLVAAIILRHRERLTEKAPQPEPKEAA